MKRTPNSNAIDTVLWFLFGRDERHDYVAPLMRRMFKLIIKTYNMDKNND